MSSIMLNELAIADGADEKLISVVPQNGFKFNGQQKGGAVPFSEALAQCCFGKFNYFLIFISGMVLANVLMETSSLSFLLPVAQCDLQLSNKDKGLLSAIGFVGIILSSHLWGFLSDTKGRRRVIRPTLLAAFVITVFSSFSNSFWLMMLLRFTNGFFISGGSATIYAYLGEFHTEKTRSRAMMGAAFIFAMGAMLLPLIAFLVINRDWTLPLPLLGIVFKPWRLFMIVCGIPGCLCGLAMYILPESPKFLLSIGKDTESLAILQKIHHWNGGKDELKIEYLFPELDNKTSHLETAKASTSNENFIVTFLHTMWNQTAPLFHKTYLRVTLIACFVQFWLNTTTGGLYMWFPHIINSMVGFMNEYPDQQARICQIVYAKHEAIYKDDGTMECISKLENTTYFYSLIMEITYATSFAFIGLIINRVGKITILFIAMIFFSSCGLAAVLISDPSIAAYLYVLLFLVGVSINVLGAATVDLYPTQLRGMAICVSLMIGRLGGVVGSYVTGALLGNHCELTFYIACSALIFCAFLALLLPKKCPEQSLKSSIEG